MDDTETGQAESDDRPPSSRASGSGTPDSSPIRSLEVQDPERRLDATRRAWLQSHGLAAMEHLGAEGEVAVRVMGDDAMAQAHERFIGFPDPTDVLTFDYRQERGSETGPAPSADEPLETDILVCLDVAEREANEHGHDAMRELLLYIVHGLLHCMGHDDTDDERAAAMHAKEDEVLRAIGVGAVYAPVADQTQRHGGDAS
ncbi:MAG: rRNA maturation RNase YbeY [Planctomycetota bacterium]